MYMEGLNSSLLTADDQATYNNFFNSLPSQVSPKLTQCLVPWTVRACFVTICLFLACYLWCVMHKSVLIAALADCRLLQ